MPYLDANAGSDANDGLTPQTAKRTMLAASLSAGTEWFIRRGGLYNIEQQFKDIGNSVTLRAYGADGANPVCRNPSGAGQMLFNCSGSGRSNITIEDIDFDCTTDTATKIKMAIYFASQGAGIVQDVTLRRIRIYGAAANGMYTGIEDNATGTVRNFLIEDSEFFDCGAHGGHFIGRNIKVRRCKVYRNGKTDPSGGHGLTARWGRTDITGGWTLVSGTMYDVAIPANKTDVGYVRILSGPLASVIRTLLPAANPLAPAVGEFGVNGASLRFNIGQAPTGHVFNYAHFRTDQILYEDCEAWGNYYNPLTPFYEGIGLAFDDYTENSVMLRCRVRDNEGAGISINQGNGNAVISCVVTNNGKGGISGGNGQNTRIEGNTVVGNDRGPYGITDGRDISYYGGGAGSLVGSGLIVRNNVVVAKPGAISTARAISTAGSAGVQANMTCQNNHVHGYTQAIETGITHTGTQTGDPMLSAGYRPLPSSPLLTGGTNTYRRDKDGRQARKFIGAYGPATLRAPLSA